MFANARAGEPSQSAGLEFRFAAESGGSSRRTSRRRSQPFEPSRCSRYFLDASNRGRIKGRFAAAERKKGTRTFLIPLIIYLFVAVLPAMHNAYFTLRARTQREESDRREVMGGGGFAAPGSSEMDATYVPIIFASVWSRRRGVITSLCSVREITLGILQSITKQLKPPGWKFVSKIFDGPSTVLSPDFARLRDVFKLHEVAFTLLNLRSHPAAFGILKSAVIPLGPSPFVRLSTYRHLPGMLRRITDFAVA